MAKKGRYIKKCDPKYYGGGVNDCSNTIRGLDKILEKIGKDKDEKN